MDDSRLEQELQRLLERYEAQPEGRLFAPLADCYRKLGRLDEAFKLCVDGLARHPRYSSGFVILGKIHLDRQESESARVAFETVLSLDPDNLLACRELAQQAEGEGDIDRALGFWRQLQTRDSGGEADAHVERLTSPGLPPMGEPKQAPPAEPPASEPVSRPEVPTTDAEVLTALSVDDVAWTPPKGDERMAPPVQTTETDADWSAAVAPREAPKPTPPPERPVAAPRPLSDATSRTEAVDADAGAAPADRPTPVARRPRDGRPEAEIVTMTLADIYSEQGFKAKALDMYSAVLARSPDTPGLQEKIQRIEIELKAIEDRATESDAGKSDPAGVDGGARRAPAGTETVLTPPEKKAEDQEDFDHFRHWLAKIKLRET